MRGKSSIVIGFAAGLVIGAGAVLLFRDPAPATGVRAGESGKIAEARPAEPAYEEAVPREEFDRGKGGQAESSVEEVRGEDGLTVSEVQERFKREQPAQWHSIAKERARRDADRRASNVRRREFLEDIDVSFLKEDQREVHRRFTAAFAERIACRDEINALRAKGESPPPESRGRFSAAERTISGNSAAERRILFEAVGRSVGVDEAELREFSTLLSDIVDVTGGGL